MSIRFRCPSCKKGFNVNEKFGGKKAKCVCGSILRIPGHRDHLDTHSVIPSREKTQSQETVMPPAPVTQLPTEDYLAKSDTDIREKLGMDISLLAHPLCMIVEFLFIVIFTFDIIILSYYKEGPGGPGLSLGMIMLCFITCVPWLTWAVLKKTHPNLKDRVILFITDIVVSIFLIGVVSAYWLRADPHELFHSRLVPTIVVVVTTYICSVWLLASSVKDWIFPKKHKIVEIVFSGPHEKRNTLLISPRISAGLDRKIGPGLRLVPAILNDRLIALAEDPHNVFRFKSGKLEFTVELRRRSKRILCMGKSFERKASGYDRKLSHHDVQDAPLGPLNELVSIRSIRSMLANKVHYPFA